MADLILKNTRAVLEMVFSAGDADGTVTVTITGADGTTVQTGSATHQGIVGSGDYTFALNPQSELNSLKVVWSGAWGGVTQSITAYADVVGLNLFSLADLRAFGDQTLNDTTKYPDADLRAARGRITDTFEDVCQASFIPRYGLDVLDASGNGRMWLSHKRVRRIIAASVDGVALSDLTVLKPYPTGRLERTTGTWNGSLNYQNVVVAYEYGWPSPPADISRAAMILARYELVSSDISDRMVSFSNDLGEVRLSVPGTKYPTGIPVVDATLARYDDTDLLPPW
jgi:hypothetical protein